MRSRRGRRTTARLLLASLLALAALVAVSTPASAHTNFLGSDPADSSALGQSPATVALDFDGYVTAALTTVGLVDAEGRAHPIMSVSVDPSRSTRLVVALPSLTRDTYRLSFSTRDPIDLHVTRGSVVFAIGSAPSLASQGPSFGEVRVAEVTLRWLGIIGLSVAVGGIVFLLAVLPAALPDGAATGRLRRRLGILAVGGAAAAVLAQALLLWSQALDIGDLSIGLGRLIQSDYGVRWLAETAILLGLLVALILSVRRRPPRRLRPVSLYASAIALTIGATVGAAISGHTGSDSSPTPVGVALRTAHLLSVEVWGGGLAALVLVIVTLPRLPVTEVPAGALKSIVAGFGRWAGPAFAVIVVTGLLLAGAEVATVTALLSTTYGVILSVKIGLVAVVSLLALRHVRMLTRRRRRDDGGSGWSRRLRVSIPGEAGVAAFIIVLAAGLASSPPARGPQFDPAPAPAPSAMTTNAADLIVRVALRPNLPGRNLLTVDVLNSRRPSPGTVRDVRVVLRSVGQATPRLIVAVHSVEQQTWDGGFVDLRSAGDLSVAVVVDRAGLPLARTELPWIVNPNRPPSQPTVVSTMPIAPIADSAAVILGLLFVGLALRRRWRLRDQERAAAADRSAAPRPVTVAYTVAASPERTEPQRLVGGPRLSGS
jgi:copper transport protein